MAVLEVTQLRLKGPPAGDPKLLESLSIVRAKLQTKSQFYSCIEDPTKLYILGLWRDLEQHINFLASPVRDEVLGPQEDMLEFQWTVHMEIESMSSLPLDAPVLALERLSVKKGCIDVCHQAATRYAHLSQGSHPCKVTHGWRCDASPEAHELVIFSGCENAQAHVTFATRQQSYDSSDHATTMGQYEELLVHHAWNLERTEAQHLTLA
ncbi:hypothetical protein GQ44DRAFT_476977 [Phaeosphaeriaceae sp. PMI808]|nr:hypothetical protein GQ44DRAFT_476977 [Phaeosphaeriaceae sp. PMI808]